VSLRNPIFAVLAASIFLGGCSSGKLHYESADASHEAGLKALEKRKCWAAQQILQNLLSDYPGSHLVDDAQFSLAKAYFCSDDYVTSIFEFERVLNEYPTSDYVDDARYEIGLCYYEQSRGIHHDQSDTEKAIREFRRFIEDYPRSDRVADAQNRIQELRNKLAEKMVMIASNYLKWRAPGSALRYCDEGLRLYPDTDLVPRMRFIQALSKQKMGELEEALEILVRLQGQALDIGFKSEIGEAIDLVRKALTERPSEPVETVSESSVSGGAAAAGH